jgi:hypothetical protein
MEITGIRFHEVIDLKGTAEMSIETFDEDVKNLDLARV